MNKEARTNGITERVFNTYMIRDYYSKTLRSAYDKDFKYAGPQAHVANGATDKAANYATQLANIAARTAHRIQRELQRRLQRQLEMKQRKTI